MSALQSSDSAIWDAIVHERRRQVDGLELIASENYTSTAVMEAAGTVLTNKYAEGYPGKRYYGGCEYVDVVENIARDRVLELFGASAQCPSVVASSASADRAHFGDRTPSAAFVTPPTLPTSLGPWPRDGRASIPARSADPLALQQSADALEVVPTPAAKYSPPKSVARPAPAPQRTRAAAATTGQQGANSP